MALPALHNRMLCVLILVSAAIHLFGIRYFADLSGPPPPSYIELDLHETRAPKGRRLPTPPPRRAISPPAQAPSPVAVQEPPALPVPKMENPPVDVPEIPKLSFPELPSVAAVVPAAVPVSIPAGIPAVPAALSSSPGGQALQPDGSAFGSAGDYFDMLNLRINSAKTYPPAARERRIEGRVTVQFTLLADGNIREVKIVKSSRNRRLDKAAVQAVEKAAPYPRPPVRYLKPPATLKINLSFELI